MNQEPEVERSPGPAAPAAMPAAPKHDAAASSASVAAVPVAAHETEDAAADPTLPLNASSILPRLRKKAYKFSCECSFTIPSSTRA